MIFTTQLFYTGEGSAIAGRQETQPVPCAGESDWSCGGPIIPPELAVTEGQRLLTATLVQTHMSHITTPAIASPPSCWAPLAWPVSPSPCC